MSGSGGAPANISPFHSIHIILQLPFLHLIIMTSYCTVNSAVDQPCIRAIIPRSLAVFIVHQSLLLCPSLLSSYNAANDCQEYFRIFMEKNSRPRYTGVMTSRKPHYLRPVKTCTAPSQIATIDVRDNGNGQISWYAIFERREVHNWTRRHVASGTRPEAFWAWLWEQGRSDTSTWVISTNWPRITWPIGVNTETESGETALGKHSWTPRIYWLELIHGKRRVELIDLRNWLAEMPADIDVEPSLVIDAALAARLTAERTHTLITSLISRALQLDFGCVQPTMGSWSLNLWRHWHSGKKLCIHCNKDVLALERAAYFGGEVLVRRLGKHTGNFTAVDVNHLYAHSMGITQLPYCLAHVTPQASISDITDTDSGIGVISRVLLETDSYAYPVKYEGYTLFARGRFWTTLADPELRMAIELGNVQQVGQTAFYHTADLCSDWSKRLWTLRNTIPEGRKSPLGTLCKLLAVTLHGRLGQHGVQWQASQSGIPMQWCVWLQQNNKGDWQWHRNMADVSECKVSDQEESFDTFPAVSAFTTSAARLLMSEYRSIAGYDNLYYQYVDSLVVDNTGYDRLRQAGVIDANRCGLLKDDGVAESIEIMGPGWLRYGDKLKASGIGDYSVQVGADTYAVAHKTSPSGLLGVQGIQPYSNVPVNTHFPPPKLWGTVRAGGWVDPPVLPLPE